MPPSFTVKLSGCTAIDLALGSGLALVAAALAFARVFVGTHYPGDVLGGAAIGGALAATIRWADPWLRPVVELGSRWTDALAARLHADPPAITPRR